MSLEIMNIQGTDYKKEIKLRYRLISKKINKRYISIKIMMYLDNKKDYKIESARLFINDKTFLRCDLAEFHGKIPLLKRVTQIHKLKFDINQVINDDAKINGSVCLVIKTQGTEIKYYLKDKKKNKDTRLNYIPFKGIYVDDFAMHFRKSLSGNLVFVKRKMEKVEYNFAFRFMGSRIISALLFYSGKIRKKIRKNKINIYYEKFCSKAEEGTYELFEKTQTSKRSTNYFIIDESSRDYSRIIKNKNVIKKYSFRYYWNIYSTDTFIATEIPSSHIEILRSNNEFLLRAVFESKFIFLQHGIVYMKNLGKTSSFCKGKDGESSKMVVSSKKELEICSKMLNYSKEHFFITGIPIYSLLKYNHIDYSSDDYVMVMLTWKPYEEHISNFESTEYYKNIVEINNLLKRHFDSEKIIIVGHPKLNNKIDSSSGNLKIWGKPISQALEKAKLLITDYSSVCYNSFYQGAGVVFYQPDIVKFEEAVGKLIPEENEYIGPRVFDLKKLEEIIETTVVDGKIQLNQVRSKEYERIYGLINEFNDGKNIERIYNKLNEQKII